MSNKQETAQQQCGNEMKQLVKRIKREIEYLEGIDLNPYGYGRLYSLEKVLEWVYAMNVKKNK